MNKFETSDFTLMVPESWKSRVMLTFSDDLTGQSQHNVTVTNEELADGDGDVFSYAAKQHEQLAGQLMQYQQLSKAVVELNGIKTPTIYYKWYTGRSFVVQCQGFFLSDNMVWTLTFTCPETHHQKFQATIEEILNGFMLNTS